MSWTSPTHTLDETSHRWQSTTIRRFYIEGPQYRSQTHMYHLIVSSDPEEYDNGWFILDRARVLKGYTCEIFTQRYAALTEHAITEIKQFPALFAYERFNKKDARIGWITRIQARDKAVRCSCSIDEALPSISWDQIDELAWDLDITIDFEMNRTHWALKDADLFDVLIEAGLMQAETLSAAPPESPPHRHTIVSRQFIEARPTVFRVPMEAPDDAPRLGNDAVWNKLSNLYMRPSATCVAHLGSTVSVLMRFSTNPNSSRIFSP